MTLRRFAVVLTGFALIGLLEAQRPNPGSLTPGSKLYVSPMEWNLDRFLAAEIQRQGLPVQVVARQDEADFVMTSLYQGLSSHMISAGHYIQVEIAAARGGQPVWTAEVNDYATFFGRFRPHGPGRAARVLVRKLVKGMSSR